MPRPPERAPQRPHRSPGASRRRRARGGTTGTTSARAATCRCRRRGSGGRTAAARARPARPRTPRGRWRTLRLAAAAVGDVRHGRERPQHLLLTPLSPRRRHRRRRQPLSCCRRPAPSGVHAHRATRPRPRTQMSAQSSPARMTTRSELSESSTEPEAAASRSILAMAGTPGDRSNRRKMA